MVTQIKISELPLASEDALSLAADDRFIFNNDNVNTQTIKFANLVDAITEQNLVFTGNCQFTQKIVGPDGGDIQVGLDDLVDVQFQNVTSGQLLQYNGAGQWINRDVSDIAVQLSSLSVTEDDTPMGGGKLEYDNTTGVFTFTPAAINTFAPASLSVVTANAASGGGGLAYNPANAVFTFTPADSYTKAESYTIAQVDQALDLKADKAETYTKNETDSALGAKATNDLIGVANGSSNMGAYTGGLINANQTVKQNIQQLETAVVANSAAGVALTDLSVVTGAGSGGGTLTYNDAGVFTFAPADLSDRATTTEVNAAIGAVTGNNLSLTNKSTDELTEGVSNLYYTEARVDARVANGIGAQTATSLRTLLGIKEGTTQGGAGAAAGEVWFDTNNNIYTVGV